MPDDTNAVRALFSTTSGTAHTMQNFEAAAEKLNPGDEAKWVLPYGMLLDYWAVIKQVDGAWKLMLANGETVDYGIYMAKPEDSSSAPIPPAPTGCPPAPKASPLWQCTPRRSLR